MHYLMSLSISFLRPLTLSTVARFLIAPYPAYLPPSAPTSLTRVWATQKSLPSQKRPQAEIGCPLRDLQPQPANARREGVDESPLVLLVWVRSAPTLW